jgi:hypothetical protein
MDRQGDWWSPDTGSLNRDIVVIDDPDDTERPFTAAGRPVGPTGPLPARSGAARD